MTPRRIVVHIDELVADDAALAGVEIPAAIEREIAQLASGRAPARDRRPRSEPVQNIAKQIYGKAVRR